MSRIGRAPIAVPAGVEVKIEANNVVTVKGPKGTKTDAAKQVGVTVAERAPAKGIDTVVFDRGGYVYHGRVKALAEGAREGGLQF